MSNDEYCASAARDLAKNILPPDARSEGQIAMIRMALMRVMRDQRHACALAVTTLPDVQTSTGETLIGAVDVEDAHAACMNATPGR